MINLYHFFRNAIAQTIHNLKANRQVFLVSVATITIALAILGLFLLTFANLESMMSTWNRQVQLIVYLEDEVDDGRRDELRHLFEGNPAVEKVTFTSRQEAWENFRNSFSGAADFIQDLDFNPLPGSFHMRFKASPDRLEKIRNLAQALENQRGVESLEYGEKWVSRFEKFMIFIEVFLLAVGGFLCLGLILIISNTIKLSYYSRQEEIELMRLVGATDRFIRTPFLMEGMCVGFFGAALSLVLLRALHYYIQLRFQGSLDFLTRGAVIQFLPFSWSLTLVLVSMAVGLVGSYYSIHQFLDRGDGR